MHKKFLYIVSLCFFLQLTGCAYYNTFYNAKKFFNEATKERKKRLKTQVVELSPEEKELMRQQGLSTQGADSRPSSMELQNYQRAIEKASAVLEFYPKSKWVDDALMLLGECFYFREEYAKSQRKFEELMRNYPQSGFSAQARLYLAKTYLGLEEFDVAEQKFREITLDKRMPKSIREEAGYELAGLYYEKANFELAAAEYRETSKESDDKIIRAMSQYRLGECLRALKQYKEAAVILKKAVKESPNEDFKSQATFKLGETQSQLGDYDDAIRTFSDLLAKEMEAKRIPMIKLQLANNLNYKGNLQNAIKWYENIIEEHKRTDASARSYFALAQMEENLHSNYKKAKENYDLVRGEFSNSLIAPAAKERSDNIKSLLELRNGINELLGIAATDDSTGADGKGNKKDAKNERDDGPIDLSSEGMWVNYSGRDRPPPVSLPDMTEEDKKRAAAMSNMAAPGDSLQHVKNAAQDSVARAAEEENKKKRKARDLAEKRLALGELLMFNFNQPDSAMSLFLQVIEEKVDTSATTRALFSIGYLFLHVKQDTVVADSVFRGLVILYPFSVHAEGARKMLGMPLLADRVDSAGITFNDAESAYWDERDHKKAIQLYRQVSRQYPDSPFAIKAKYAIGWIYENVADQPDSALSIYKQIVNDSPGTTFATRLKKKLDAYERFLQEQEAKKKALEDSLANAAKQKLLTAATADSGAVKMDSLNLVLADSNATASLEDSISGTAGLSPGAVADSLNSIATGLNSPAPGTTPKVEGAATTASANDSLSRDEETAMARQKGRVVRTTRPEIPDERAETAAPGTANPPAPLPGAVPKPEGQAPLPAPGAAAPDSTVRPVPGEGQP